MSSEQLSLAIDPIRLYDTPFPLSMISKTNAETDYRKRVKKIITNEATGESFFHKAVTTEFEPDSVTNLIREFSFLEKLTDSGVTPKPYILKVSPDRSQGVIAMEALPGKSLRERQIKSKRINSHLFDSLLTKTFLTLEIIHQNGIFIGDITPESFIIDLNKKRGIESVKIVDFEHAIEDTELEKVSDRIKGNYVQSDIGLYRQLLLHNAQFESTEYILTEQYTSALTLLRYMLGSSYGWAVDTDSFSDNDALLFQQQTQELLPFATQKAETAIMQRYLRFGEDCAREIARQEALGQVKEDMKIYMINITLPYLLEQKGIRIKENHIRYLQRTLNPDLQKRI